MRLERRCSRAPWWQPGGGLVEPAVGVTCGQPEGAKPAEIDLDQGDEYRVDVATGRKVRKAHKPKRPAAAEPADATAGFTIEPPEKRKSVVGSVRVVGRGSSPPLTHLQGRCRCEIDYHSELGWPLSPGGDCGPSESAPDFEPTRVSAGGRNANNRDDGNKDGPTGKKAQVMRRAGAFVSAVKY